MSENIFKEIYAKVLSLFKQTEKEDNAKDIAKNRLRVVLMQDRTNLTPELLQRMRKELVELLSKYVEMDKEALELNLDQEGDQMALMLSIPVIRAKDEAEIEKALAEEKETDDSEEETEIEDSENDDSVIEETDETDSDEDIISETEEEVENETEDSKEETFEDKSEVEDENSESSADDETSDEAIEDEQEAETSKKDK